MGSLLYGDDRRLRQWLEDSKQAYVVAVSGKEHIWIDQQQRQVKALLADLPLEGWERLTVI